MSKSHTIVSRTSAVAAAAILLTAAVLPTLMLGRADAAQLQTRSIQLSNSATGATGVSYKAQFNAATTSTVKGFVIDICSGNSSPLLGTTCTLMTTGFSWNAPDNTDIVTFTVNGVAQTVAAAPTSAQWGVSTVEGGRALTLASVDGVAVNAGQTVVIEVSNVTNTGDVDTVTGGNQVGTFYGRLASFPNNSGANSPVTYTDAATEANLTDFGGSAMSTTNNLNVTARVQESLTFCLYTNGPGQTCATGTGSAIDIPNATTPLSSTANTTANAYFSVASNALSGVNIRMWSNNGSDGVLKTGTYTITAFGGVVDDACTADSVNSSIEQFGMRVIDSAAVTSAEPYNCAAGNHGWDTDTAAGIAPNDTTSVGSAYGDTIASTAGANDAEENVLEFAAKSALTTEAGIYTTSLNYIATGTY